MNLEKLIHEYQNKTETKEIAEYLGQEKQNLHLKGLVGSSDAFTLAGVYLNSGRPMIVVLPNYEEASYLAGDLENILNKQILLFPGSFRKSLDFTQENSNYVLQRAETLNLLDKKNSIPKIVVTYPEALVEKVINRQDLEKNTLEITKGNQLSIDFINEFLYAYEFDRVDFVYEPGQFAVRGGIVDIFSYSNDLPYRVEFFGDEVDGIRSFEVESQLSVQQMDTISIIPNVQSDKLTSEHISLIEYIGDETSIWFKEMQHCLDIVHTSYAESEELWQAISEEDKKNNPEWQNPKQSFITAQELQNLCKTIHVIEFGKQFILKPSATFSFDILPQPSFNKDFDLLIHNFKENEKENIQNLIFSSSKKQIERIYSILEDMEAQVQFIPIHTSIREGFIDKSVSLGCFTDHQIFDRYYKYKRRKGYERSQAITLKELRDLKSGDYITHIDHGVGKYAGLEKIEVNGRSQEMIRLIYADNDLLYVNINSLNRIAKYSGKEGTVPKINKLGTDAWEKLKKKTKQKVKDIARDLIKLYAKRKSQTGTAFSPDTYLQTELEASFMYEDTPDQEKATAEVKKDMESPNPMDRLVCGDVGFGKTEIAIRAAFKAVADSKQVAILVPTTILALQHYNTFKERLEGFPCNVDYINRFKTSKQIKETLSRLANGELDIIIGTHRLVSKDVKFKDLGLMIVDEEQKFGVSVKEKLKALRANVDSLTLSATPIPRTLHFSLMGARDLSIISTPPPNRQPVHTELHVFNEKLIQEAVTQELERDGQVFFIHNRVADLENLRTMIANLVPQARIGVAHGQLEGSDLENIMLKFINHEYDVLIATTIIESGLDISNANTIIINQAHMFGLSDLHQMRGRVGRSNKKAYCYLLSPPLSTLTNEAYKRLSAVEEFSELGSGFNVAMRDLDIRGSGNLLGAEQSGFIAEIGFEMYNKILDEAVAELKDEEFSDLFKDQEKNKDYVSFTQIDTDLEVLIPDEYVTNVTERYNLYTEISNINDEETLEKFAASLEDRFGPVPDAVLLLFDTLRLQWLGKSIGMEKISYKKQNVLRGYFIKDSKSLYYESETFDKVLEFVQKYPDRSNLKEVRGQLRIAISGIKNIKEAIEFLEKMKS
ncbi:MAG TPA: transcription-repair coupling factor [Sphingobacterium sp.]|nr:transcription-repair coupling factor [Sphingobacterium sp.]